VAKGDDTTKFDICNYRLLGLSILRLCGTGLLCVRLSKRVREDTKARGASLESTRRGDYDYSIVKSTNQRWISVGVDLHEATGNQRSSSFLHEATGKANEWCPQRIYTQDLFL
jgi:hypothetical protein